MERRLVPLLAVVALVVVCAGSVTRLPRSPPPEVSRVGATLHQELPPVAVHGLVPGLRGTEWERIPTTKRVVALTFDACGDDRGAASILSTLVREQVAATFFLCGRWVEHYPATARTIAARHAVGNHTATHPYLTELSDARVRAEVSSGARAIREATPADPVPLFRFPYGDRDARTIRLVNDLGYGSIRWTVDTLGWKGSRAGQSAGSVRARVLAALRPGAIVLMHVGAANDGTTLDAAALPSVISSLRTRGYALVDLHRYAAMFGSTADDASPRLVAPGWRTGRSGARYGPTFRYATPSAQAEAARFRLHLPQTSTYRVSAWWPASRIYNAATPFVVDTVTGSRVIRVDQRAGGGRWTSLGLVRLRAGDVSVRVSRAAPGSGLVVADAVRIRTP